MHDYRAINRLAAAIFDLAGAKLGVRVEHNPQLDHHVKCRQRHLDRLAREAQQQAAAAAAAAERDRPIVEAAAAKRAARAARRLKTQC